MNEHFLSSYTFLKLPFFSSLISNYFAIMITNVTELFVCIGGVSARHHFTN